VREGNQSEKGKLLQAEQGKKSCPKKKIACKKKKKKPILKEKGNECGAGGKEGAPNVGKGEEKSCVQLKRHEGRSLKTSNFRPGKSQKKKKQCF